MAKSASDTKLEDVLSSVRRLVSDELPRNERPKLPEGPGALVLTDAQRIESNAAVRIAGRSLEERIAELEAAVGNKANDDEFEPDGSEDQAEHRPDRIVYTRPPQPEEADEMRRGTLRLSQIALIDTGPANDDLDEDNDVQLQFRREVSQDAPDPDEAPMAEDVKETLTAAEVHIFTSPDDEVARIEALLNGQPELEKALETKADAPIGWPVETAIQKLKLEEADDADASEADADDTQNAAEHSDPDADFDADLEAAVSAVDEDTIEDNDDNIGDETFEGDPDTAGEPEEAITEAAIEEVAIAGAAIEETVAATLGEDELRPLVAKLIREELQGELGERITRNVRKLVRREILRALAARDAE